LWHHEYDVIESRVHDVIDDVTNRCADMSTDSKGRLKLAASDYMCICRMLIM